MPLDSVLTLVQGTGIAKDFTGPVFTSTGENDFIFCGGKCTQTTGSLLAKVADYYPGNNGRSTYDAIPGTGHGNNLHKTAEAGFNNIQAWFVANGF